MDDEANGSCTDAVPAPDGRVRRGACQFADFVYGGVGELDVPMLFALLRSAFRSHVGQVVGLSAHAEVRGVDARAVVAGVPDDGTRGYVNAGETERDTMGVFHLAAVAVPAARSSESAVPRACVDGGEPWPALIGATAIDLRPEAVFGRHGALEGVPAG